MPKIAILTDTHSGVKNGNSIFLDYFSRFFGEVFFPYCKEHGIKHIIHAGDYYDNRTVTQIKGLHHNRKSFLEPLIENGMFMDIIPGNHDLFFKNTSEVCSLKEHLGYFINNINIVTSPKVIEIEGYPFAFLPWINESNYDESMRFIKKSTKSSSVLISHLDVEGFDMMPGVKSTHGMNPKLFERFNMVLTGHFHTKSTKGNITYLGAPYEMTWSDCDDPKYFHVFDTDTQELIPVRNPLTIYKKFWYNDGLTDPEEYLKMDMTDFQGKFVRLYIVEKNNSVALDRFIQLINNANPIELKIIEDYSSYNATSVGSEMNISSTQDLIKDYIDALELDSSIDKSLILREMINIYNEADSYDTV